MISLAGKKVLITGGASGIGKAVVQCFVERGAQVTFTYHSSIESVKEMLNMHNAEKEDVVNAYNIDFADKNEAKIKIGEVAKEMGHIDILINNVGMISDKYLIMMSDEKWEKILQVNLSSCFLTTRAAMPYMLDSKGSSIINISSVGGISGNEGQTNYAAAKAGIIGFTKSLAKELGGRNIRVNAIAPGYIDTKMLNEINPKKIKEYIAQISLKRIGKPEEVANTALFLASNFSSYITGQVIVIDGGLI